ncbi:MAG: hypothetical protein ABMA01_20265 [Chthoniobacteraceae bacterium]
MAEIKFRCPECSQKIAVGASAAGVKIDCPTCHSRRVIPRSELAPVEVVIKRKLAIVGGSADAVYSELQKVQAAADKAEEELKRLRAERMKDSKEADEKLAMVTAARDSLQAEVTALKPMRDQLADAQKELARVGDEAAGKMREQSVQLDTARKAATTLKETCATLQTKHAAAEASLADHAEKMRALEQKRAELEARAAKLETTVGELSPLREQLAKSEEDKKALKAKHAKSEERLAEMINQIATLEEDRNGLAAKVTALSPLQEQLSETQRTLANSRDEAVAAAREQAAQLESARKAGEALKGTCAELQTKLCNAEAALAQQAGDFAMLQQQHASRLAAIEQQRAEFEAAASNLNPLREQLAREDQEKEMLVTKLAESAGMLAALRKERNELAGKVSALTPIREQFLETQKSLTAAREETQQLRGQLGELTRFMDAAKAEKAQIASLATERQQAIEKLTHELDAAKAESGRLRDEATAKAGGDRRDDLAEKRDRELAELKQLLETTRAELAAKDANLRKLTKDHQDLTRLVDEKEKALGESRTYSELHKPLEQENARLADELARKSAELEVARLEAAKANAAGGNTAAAGNREKALEAERDSLRAELDGVKAALERAKQHVNVLQARRDLLRDEIAALRARIGTAGTVTT